MNITKRKKSQRESGNEDEQLIQPKETKKKIKQKDKKPNLVYPLIIPAISLCLFAYVYFVLLREDNLIPFHNINSPFFATKQIDNKKWGTFRSGHYFGLKTLSEQSLVFGLMWFENRIINNNVQVRHWCDQSDQLTKYGWLKHDFHSFGIQEIVDNDFNITTSFLIADNQSSDWKARVKIDLTDSIKNQIRVQEKRINSTKIRINKELSLIPYFALDSLQDESEDLQIDKKEIKDGEFTIFQMKGKTKVFKDGFNGRIIVKSKDLIYSSGLNSTINPPLLEIKENLLQNLILIDYPGQEMNNKKSKYLIALRKNLNNKKKEKTNLALQQIVVKVPTIVSFEFNENGVEKNVRNEDYLILLKNKEENFDLKFEQSFNLKNQYSNEILKFAKASLSNMIGSIGSFYGFSQVSLIEDNKLIKKENRKIYKYGPLKLLTSVPSRSFFPRGFLWDDGFHQLLISKYDLNLSKIIVSNWLNIMNKKGWIPREIVLGVEAENRVPDEFIVQNVHVANPPTFFLAIDSFLSKNQKDSKEEKEYFEQLFNKLVVWYDWFNRTQNGFKPGSYRWRGRNREIKTELNIKTLSSGLDDYPRASTPTDQELHLDLLSWMFYATKIMGKLSEYLNNSNYERFNNYLNWLKNDQILDKLHWSEDHQLYCDFGLHSNKVILKQIRTSNNQLMTVRKELEPAKYGCVNEFGYVSLFPLILQLIEPNNPRLGILLDKLKDRNLLWTNYGLRSLSKNSSYYDARNTEHDPPYWRSAIWVNINYLAIKSLDYYSKQSGPFKDKAKLIYNELKNNLVQNIYNEFKNRNYLYENYDDKTGQGKGCYPFTGWTALVVLIMSPNH